MNRFPQMAASGVAHSWVGDRNHNRNQSERDLYEEIELSELMSLNGFGLMGIHIHWNRLGFLQADAIGIKYDKNGDNPQYFVLAIPSRLTGGHGRYSPSETMPNTVCDDMVLRFEKKDDKEFNPPTWIAAVYDKEVVELYGDTVDERKINYHMEELSLDRLYKRNKQNEISSWDNRYFKPLLGYLMTE